MIKHIVMWTFKDNAEGADKAANAKKMKELLEKGMEACRAWVEDVATPKTFGGYVRRT